MKEGEESLSSPVQSSPRELCVRIQCYEGPEGRGPGILEIDEEALCRHLFVCGSTGSGKTTLLRALTRQLIAADAADPAKKVGLVILDAKSDGTVAHVKAAAAAVGRSEDVCVLSLESDAAYDFFGECRRLNQANDYAERLVFGCNEMRGGNDVFWNEFRHNLLSAALIWLISLHAERRTFADWITHAASWLLAERLTPEHHAELESLRTIAAGLKAGTAARIAIDHALRLIEEWDGVLDPRTRSNARATLHNALRPMLEESILHLFRTTSAKKLRVASAIDEGRILVIDTPAFLHPHLAPLVLRSLKTDFYQAVVSRARGGRLVMLIADEFQLAATAGNSRYDDATALPLLREYRAGMVAATQTLVGLDKVVGTVNRRLLLANFNTIAFLRSTEADLQAFAEQVCGTMETDITTREHFHDPFAGEAFAPRREWKVTRRVRRSICQRGALARLEPGQAYILRQSGEPFVHPVWIAADGL